jgi:hypothetical protein
VKKPNVIHIVILMMALTFMLLPASSAMAGGDKNRGDNGQGSTYENGCEDQPCFETAPKPGASEATISMVSNAAATLDETEIENLLYIREEEKLARDVYLTLAEEWGNPIFAIIGGSEQVHMDAIKNLLDFYGIEDSVTDDTVGAFNDPYIAGLFELLILQGLESPVEAILVGGHIEEIDILDLWEAYGETDEDRIRRVYQNLYEGSYNHLGAFVYNYELLTGIPYYPQELSLEDFEYVLSYPTKAKQAQQPKQQKGQ